MSARPAVRAVVAMALAVGVWVACSGGLNLEEGNAFPCDFLQAEEARDQQCPPQWRCGIDGRCHEAADEQAPLGAPPVFGGERRFPRLLTGDTRFIAAETRERLLFTSYEDGGVYLTREDSTRPVSGLSDVRLVAYAGNYLLVQGERGQTPPARLRLHGLNALTGALSPERPVLDEEDRPVTDVESIRALSVPSASGTRVVFAVVRADGRAGEVDPVSARYTAFPGGFPVLSDGGVATCPARDGGCPSGGQLIPGRYTEARHVPFQLIANQRQQQASPQLVLEPVPVVATASHILWRERPPDETLREGQWHLLYTSELAGVPPPDAGPMPAGPGSWMMRHSERANLWAVKRQQLDREVLSTFELSRAPGLPGPVMSLAWDDCSPCGDGRLITFTPVADGALGVEVLCESRRGVRSMFRVVGSSVVAPREPCLLQPLEPPFELKELASRQLDGGLPFFKAQAMDESRGASLVMGGAHGQVWVGPSLSRMRPVFLDRAPVAAELFQGGLLAFTPDFLALGGSRSDEASMGMVVMTGAPDGGAPTSLGLGNVVQGLSGWLLGAQGQIVQLERRGREVALSGYGPRLVGPSGQSATGPFQGQGTTFEGGVSMVLTAHDQLYYVDLPRAELTQEPEEVRTLSPRLTPDPNFPLRSLARDQTVSLTGGTPARVRGWVSTDRSVFQFEQASATGGWTLRALPIGDGEPVEVWSREAGGTSYGRLGLRNGLVLRLPQGLPLTQNLPEGERVVDYASLAGWPVALGERAIYRTAPTQLSGGAPGLLKWERLEPLPEGLTVSDLEGARIAVVNELGVPTLYLFTRTGFVYRLGEGAR
jgi:hypothetical protein